MQNLTKLMQDLQKTGARDQPKLNLIREYLQVLTLKAIYQSKYGRGLSFIGGTCLRICRDLKRFSEDLDFNYDQKIPGYDFIELNQGIVSALKNNGFLAEFNAAEDKTVQKSFIKVSQILHGFQLSPLKDQKLHIKLEIDTRPPLVQSTDIETFFVTKFNELFPILKHTDSTLFSGKIAAVLMRPYAKGRDFYDLIWYLKQKIQPNLDYLNECLKQANQPVFTNTPSAVLALEERVNSVPIQTILDDLRPFLEDTEENKALQHYPLLFQQLVGYLRK